MYLFRKAYIIAALCTLPVLLMAQAIEIKPRNAPHSEKHRNKIDELGQRQGTWMYFNSDGEKQSEIDYVNDKKEGMCRRFFPGGKIAMDETEYFDDKKEGGYKKYYISGETQTEGEYKRGNKEGRWVKTYVDGTIKTEGNYTNGKTDGTWKFYDRKARIIKEIKYINGIEVNANGVPVKKDVKTADKSAKGAKPTAGKVPTK